ncbi:hypothetical protein ABZZ79_04700 [Streptomyces sp. NPDC006458]|uniref:hypothetical protein n=1 Tax=Streptomyces sp. NPDC006458 TaxID=3154302 RepID=UPI0033A2E074
MDRAEPVCPDCGQPVGTVVRRYKTLGAWVPKWEAGPCRNPECPSFPEKDTDQERPHERERHEPPDASVAEQS